MNGPCFNPLSLGQSHIISKQSPAFSEGGRLPVRNTTDCQEGKGVPGNLRSLF